MVAATNIQINSQINFCIIDGIVLSIANNTYINNTCINKSKVFLSENGKRIAMIILCRYICVERNQCKEFLMYSYHFRIINKILVILTESNTNYDTNIIY